MSDVVEPQFSDPPAPIPPGGERDPEPSREPTGRVGRVLTALALLLLFVFGAWLFVRERALEGRLAHAEQAQNTGDPARLTAFEDALRAETARTAEVEKQLDALQVDVRRIDGATHPSDAGALEGRVKILEDKVSAMPDVAALETRLKAVEDKPAVVADPALPGRLDAVNGQLDALGKKLATAQSDAQAAQASAKSAQQEAAAAQARADAVLARAAATAALEAGQPLGKLATNDPKLARFATEPPPTEASLRLSFDAAAKAATSASQPSTAGESFGQRMLTRASSLVTVRQGDRVLVGAPAATTLSAAKAKLQAGDLAGAVATLDGLDPAATAAMADWRARAQSLLDLRGALATDKLGSP